MREVQLGGRPKKTRVRGKDTKQSGIQRSSTEFGTSTKRGRMHQYTTTATCSGLVGFCSGKGKELLPLTDTRRSVHSYSRSRSKNKKTRHETTTNTKNEIADKENVSGERYTLCAYCHLLVLVIVFVPSSLSDVCPFFVFFVLVFVLVCAWVRFRVNSVHFGCNHEQINHFFLAHSDVKRLTSKTSLKRKPNIDHCVQRSDKGDFAEGDT